MRLATTLNLFAAMMLALCGFAVSLSVWNTLEAERNQQRVTLADDVYALHLSLAANSYQLVKKFGDAHLLDRSANPEAMNRLSATIRAEIAEIRKLIAAEIELVGEEEIEELEALAVIEARIAPLLALAEGSPDTWNQAPNAEWSFAYSSLERGEPAFRVLIANALEEEREEVEETRAEAAEQAMLSRILAIILTVIAIAVTAFALSVFRARLAHPVARLRDGVEKLSQGDYSARVETSDAGEIAEIGAVVNEMAEQVEANAAAMKNKRAELEAAVESRTRQLERLLADAKQSAESRKRLMADVSHELRTPLTIIRGEADVALRGAEKPVEEYREALTRTRDAASHTARLVDDLLFVARAESGEARLKTEDVDLVEIVRSASRHRGETVELILSADAAIVEADPDRLKQCVIILLENALRYGGGATALRLDRAVGGWRIAVEDDGPGLSEEDIEMAFERYFRGSNAADRYADGTGLGLPVAKGIIEAHGGSVRLENRPEGGLAAIVTLPARGRSAAA